MKSQVLSCYRNLLRSAHKWPVEEMRKERNMKEYLLGQIRKSFKENKEEKDSSQIELLIKFAKSETNSINALLSNSISKQV